MNAEATPRISVIVPCHNIEGFLPVCLASLTAQTHESFEVICIDDGSTDATGRMLDDRAAMDVRFRVIHQGHQGPSAARNAGLEIARAQLISYVDGDDYVSPRYLEVLDAVMSATGADIACCGHMSASPDAPATLDDWPSLVEDSLACISTIDARESLAQIATEEINFAFWCKLFKRELVEAHPFPVGMVYEDIWNLGGVFADAKTVATVPAKLYCYVARHGSITRAKPAPMRTFWQFREAMERFEATYAERLGLAHATDDASYCLHLVHRLCGQHTTLQSSKCEDVARAQISEALHEELDAAFRLALLRGVSPLHPQMIRAALLLNAPALHDRALVAYRQLTGA